jgi:DNA polymerase-3 subunit delta
MKATQKDFAAVAPRAARKCSVFFFCGPDESGAAAAAQRIAGMLDDPGERIELSGGDLRRDPVLLGDEARSISLFGGNRHIIVRASGDEAHDAVETLLGGTGAACPVLIVATSATDKARTAKLLEKRDDALVAMFWPPDLASVTASVRSMIEAAGLRCGNEIAERLARAAGLDVAIAQSEVSKLALYLDASPQSPRTLDERALDEIGAKTEDDGLMPIVNAVLSGQTNRLSGELHRMAEVSLNPLGVLLAFERRAAQLSQVSARLGNRRDVCDFVRNDSRVFFKEKRDVAAQLAIWRGDRLARMVAKLIELHRAMLATNSAADEVLAQGLAMIAREAARAERR